MCIKLNRNTIFFYFVELSHLIRNGEDDNDHIIVRLAISFDPYGFILEISLVLFIHQILNSHMWCKGYKFV